MGGLTSDCVSPAWEASRDSGVGGGVEKRRVEQRRDEKSGREERTEQERRERKGE